MKKQNVHNKIGVGLLAVAVFLIAAPSVSAQLTADSELSQEIVAGTISTDIRDNTGAIVGAPSFSMDQAVLSTSQQSVNGVFGDDNQRISVDNPGGAPSGWTLTLNASDPGTGVWSNVGDTESYAYNGSAAAGSLTVNPAAGVLTSVTGTNNGITLGTSSAFSGVTPITLMTASGLADNIWNGYLTGVGLTQTIPASQPAGAYTLELTQTLAAS